MGTGCLRPATDMDIVYSGQHVETRSGGLTRKAKDGTWEAAESLFVTQHILRKLTTTGQAPF